MPPGKTCAFFLPQKGRHCNLVPRHGEIYCSVHLFELTGQGQQRVPCPHCSTGVLSSVLQKHIKQCPAWRREASDRESAFFHPGVNAGTDDEGCAQLRNAVGERLDPASGRQDPGRYGERAAEWRVSLIESRGGPPYLRALMDRVVAAHATICTSSTAIEELCPPEGQRALTPDPSKPAPARHAAQNVSIVAHMARRSLCRLVPDDEAPGACAYDVIEFGAGKGFLSSALVEMAGAPQSLHLLDTGAFKRSADRVLRRSVPGFKRHRCNVMDFDPVKGMMKGNAGGAGSGGAGAGGKGAGTFDSNRDGGGVGGRDWVGIGKHLCGAATDLTLRCCARSRAGQGRAGVVGGAVKGTVGDAVGGVAGAAGSAMGGTAGSMVEGAVGSVVEGAVGSAVKGAVGGVAGGAACVGVAVATCCHHRCTWRHFCGKQVLVSLGFDAVDFEVLCWMSGWALSGHRGQGGKGVAVGGMMAVGLRTVKLRVEEIARVRARVAMRASVVRGFWRRGATSVGRARHGPGIVLWWLG